MKTIETIGSSTDSIHWEKILQGHGQGEISPEVGMLVSFDIMPRLLGTELDCAVNIVPVAVDQKGQAGVL